MKRAIACIAAVFLALASGSVGAEEDKTRHKIYTHDNGEVILSLLPFWNGEFVYAVCEGADADKKCKVYLESTEPTREGLKSCDLKLNYTDRFDYNVILTNAGNSKAVFTVRDCGHKVKLVNVNLNDCKVSEVTVEATLDRHGYLFSSVVVPHPDGTKYALLHRNKQLCSGNFCIATFDYDGKVLSPPVPFPVTYAGALVQVAYDNVGYIVAQNQRSSSSVFLVKEDGAQFKETTLFHGSQRNAYFVGFSTKENKVGFCAINDEKVVCQQHDVEGKKKLVETELKTTVPVDSVRQLDVMNLNKGFLALSVTTVMEKCQITITHVDDQGKPGKTVTVDPQCEEVDIAKLYKTVSGEYCINSICMSAFDTRDRSQFKRATRCFLQTELF